MKCPSCLCSAHHEVTIDVGGTSKKYLECEYCGDLWSPHKTRIHMNCPKCTNTLGVDVVLNAGNKLPNMLCRACESHLTVKEDANSN